MKILIDFFPILLFFGAFKVYDIYVGTGVLMAATLLQMGLIYAIDHKLTAMHKITLALVLIFGTLLALLESPFEEHPGFDEYASFPPDWASSIEISCSS